MRRNIAYALRNSLKAKKMTQRELAAKSGIPEATIRSWAQGSRMANENQIKVLAEVLGVDEIELYQDEYSQMTRYVVPGGVAVKARLSEEPVPPAMVIDEIPDDALANFFLDNLSFGGKKMTRKKLRRIIEILLEN